MQNCQYFKSQGRGQFLKVSGDLTVIVCNYDFNPSLEINGSDPKLGKALKAVPCTAADFILAHRQVSDTLKEQAADLAPSEYYKSGGNGQFFKITGKRMIVVCAYSFSPGIEITTSNAALISALKCQPITGKEFRHAYRQISDHVAAQAVETVELLAAA